MMIANWYLYGNYSLSEVSYRVIDLCWEMEKSRDWGVGWESSTVSRTRILLPEANSYVQPYCAGHSYQAASNESPDGYSIIFASPLSAINSHFPEGGR